MLSLRKCPFYCPVNFDCPKYLVVCALQTEDSDIFVQKCIFHAKSKKVSLLMFFFFFFFFLLSYLFYFFIYICMYLFIYFILFRFYVYYLILFFNIFILLYCFSFFVRVFVCFYSNMGTRLNTKRPRPLLSYIVYAKAKKFIRAHYDLDIRCTRYIVRM